jgi:O-antigen ligase
VLAGFLVFGLMVGLLQGGDFNSALWESRYLFYVVVGYFLTAHYVQDRAHVQRLVSVFLVAVGVYGIEGTFRYFALIQTHVLKLAPEFLYGHEVPVFLTGYIVLVLAMFVLGAPKWQRVVGVLLMPTVLFTLLGSGRRAGQICLIISLVVMALVWLFVHRKAFLMMSIPMLLIALVYFPLFWNSTGVLGQPARAVRSLYDPSSRDASSDNYRDLEGLNVTYAIQNAPLTGIGFGRPFIFYVPLPDLSWWPFWHYEPHHNLLWVWMKMGMGGFIAFFALMTAALARSARIIRVNTLPEARILAMLAIACLVSTLVFSWVDLGLVNPRLTLLMGVVLGGISRLSDGDTRDKDAIGNPHESAAAA